MLNGKRFVIAAVTALAVLSANVSLPQVGLVYVNLSGLVAYAAGTSDAQPIYPGVPNGRVKLAELSVPSGVASLSAGQITNIRDNNYNTQGLFDGTGKAFVADIVTQGPMADIRAFGADPTGVQDSSTAIQTALNNHSHVLVPPGIYRCDTMIELGEQKTLQLLSGSVLLRDNSYSNSIDPVVWIKGSYASIIGVGQGASRIQSKNRSPKGVVRLGHKDMTESHGNVLYCSLKDIRISGAKDYGQTTGEPDVALYMPCPQFKFIASYFHTVTNILVEKANIGIYLHGWTNACTFTSIQGLRIGNTSLYPNAFVYYHGALENQWFGSFFHDGPNSIGLLVDKYDNTANGGSIHTPMYNSFVGFACEQGGASAVALKHVAGTSSRYQMIANVPQADILDADFWKTNIKLGTSYIYNWTVYNDLNINGSIRNNTTVRRSYSGIGTRTITIKFGTTLSGAVYRNAIAEVMFAGIKPDGLANEAAKYYLKIHGRASWDNLVTTKIYGSDLTITKTASTADSITFTVDGGSPSQVVSVDITVTAHGGATLF